MPEPIRQIVEQTWRDAIGFPPDWTPTQVDTFLDSEADRLAEMIETQMGSAQGSLVDEWIRKHDHAPDYPTTVSLIETARRSITEQVLTSELYEKIPNREDPFPPAMSVPEWRESQEREQRTRLSEAKGDPQRWKHPLRRSDPQPEIDELARRLWPDRSALFRVTGSFLLQTRQEDAQPIPTGPEDPLAVSFTNLVSEALTETGRPLDGPGKLADR
ncbi:hypothetical protein OG921_04795 [Aldersonia sp. NBC_00410]|uniref:hypothetical protein n=1 Tax=Aldersonia sp. NBC_00410 TaxID=2975954 RepID=UPI00224D0174|nr:hypothetical protein [Aldersonia sp. NBC_00410]MCX5042490.1 hypothetical protein [Aldersonia sp. NBC_00410]